MSTKIHNGYRLAAGTSMFGLLRQIQAGVFPVYERLYSAAVTRQATFDADDNLLGRTSEAGTVKAVSPLSAAIFAMDRAHAQIAKTGHRNPRLDFNFQVTVMPDPQSIYEMYAVIFTEQAEYRKVWEDLFCVEPFGYWNNTDRPADVTEDAWAERQQIWDRVIPSFAAPSTLGWTWSLIGEMHSVPKERLLELAHELIPSKTDRAYRITRGELLDEMAPAGASIRQISSIINGEEFAAEAEKRATALADELEDLRVEDLDDIRPLVAEIAARTQTQTG